MILETISSSSRANCHVLVGHHSSVMLDCGVASSKASMALGNQKYNIQAVLLTHSHSDHIKAFMSSKIRLCGAMVYGNEECLEKCTNINSYDKNVIEVDRQYGIGDEWLIQAFEVPHDKRNFAYIIYNKYYKETTLYYTDVGKVTQFTIDFHVDYFIIEANYDKTWYNNVDNLSDGERIKYQRLSSDFGHISLQDTVEFLNNNIHDDPSVIAMVHISQGFEDYKYFERYAKDNLKYKNTLIKAISNRGKDTTELTKREK